MVSVLDRGSDRNQAIPVLSQKDLGINIETSKTQSPSRKISNKTKLRVELKILVSGNVDDLSISE
jgi:hypothetical protein